ncbi:MAG TPA: glutamate--cysteine ligase [Streptosporangiaceae bacterium]|nr:glutamate--cysteine ligase [Streptosporangiaceae bacterium]
MGQVIDKDTFSESEYLVFRERLDACLDVLGAVIERPGFGAGATTIGAELELSLVDAGCRPLPCNEAIRTAAGDSRIALELNRYNLELNSSPVPLAGRPFEALGKELAALLELVADTAAAHGGRPAVIGILPTVGPSDLGQAAITEVARYRALSNGLRRLRQSPFRIQIAGTDRLDLVSDDITPEGANTSFQVHMRVDPVRFARVYNAAQLATAAVLAVAGNSPTFLGRRLWDETRIALFKQAVDDRPAGPHRTRARTSLGTGWLRGGAGELFADSVRRHEPILPVIADADPWAPAAAGEAPALGELRLHQGTVWPWNRAIYDPAAGGHLRIEMRVLPAGPTVTDMMANAAYLIGLTLWIGDQDERWTYALPFERADRNFYRAAQDGLSAELTWPAFRPDQTRTVRAADLVGESLPAAREGLLAAGVTPAEADPLLEVIGARASSGQTGAAWQRAALAAAMREPSSRDPFAVMLGRYLDHAATGLPVHTWPVVTRPV